MLYLISLPPPLQEGAYLPRLVSREAAGAEIRERFHDGRLESLVTFADTARVLSEISGVSIRLRESRDGRKAHLPALVEGDVLLQAKLRIDANRSRLSPGDFEFLRVDYGAAPRATDGEAARVCEALTLNALRVFKALGDWRTIGDLAAKLEVTERTVFNALGTLDDLGIVIETERVSDKTTAVRYRLGKS